MIFRDPSQTVIARGMALGVLDFIRYLHGHHRRLLDLGVGRSAAVERSRRVLCGQGQCAYGGSSHLDQRRQEGAAGGRETQRITCTRRLLYRSNTLRNTTHTVSREKTKMKTLFSSLIYVIEYATKEPIRTRRHTHRSSIIIDY